MTSHDSKSSNTDHDCAGEWVPAAKYPADGRDYLYNAGWNACRAAMLAASPQAPESGVDRRLLRLADRLWSASNRMDNACPRVECAAAAAEVRSCSTEIGDAARSLLDALEASERASEGRRVALCEKAEEARREWLRAEAAEASVQEANDE